MGEYAAWFSLHMAQVLSPVKPHSLRFAGMGRVLYVEWSRKDRARGSMVISEDHGNFITSAPSQPIWGLLFSPIAIGPTVQ